MSFSFVIRIIIIFCKTNKKNARRYENKEEREDKTKEFQKIVKDGEKVKNKNERCNFLFCCCGIKDIR